MLVEIDGLLFLDHSRSDKSLFLDCHAKNRKVKYYCLIIIFRL